MPQFKNSIPKPLGASSEGSSESKIPEAHAADRAARAASDSSATSTAMTTPPITGDPNSGKIPEEKLSVLVVMNKLPQFDQVFSFLGRRGYQITLVHDTSDLIKKILVVKPKLILLSFNLKNTDSKKLHLLITEKFKILCVTFAEDSTANTAAALMNGGFTHTILPPVSGPAIHLRIQNILRKEAAAIAIKEAKKKNPHQNNESFKIDYDIGETKPSEIEGDTVWSKTKNSHKADPEHITWKGVSQKAQKVYYFKGQQQPEFDKSGSGWQLGLHKGGIFTRPLSPGGDFLLDQEGAQDRDFEVLQESLGDAFDGDAQENTLEKDSGHIIQTAEAQPDENPSPSVLETKTDEQKEPTPSILVQAVRASLEQLGHTIVKGSKVLSKIRKISLFTIESNKFTGFLAFANSYNFLDENQLLQLSERIGTKMKSYGQPISPVKRVYDFEISTSPFSSWSRQTPEFQIFTQLETLETGVAFYSIKRFPQITEVKDPTILSIKLETDLFVGHKLLFDLYLYLPKNDKYILYLSKNTLLEHSTVQKLEQFGVKDVFIKSASLFEYQEYFAKSFLLKKTA